MREQKFRYTYRRKKDGHIYQIIVSLKYIEQQECNEIHTMQDNDLWELIARDEYLGITDKNGKDIYEGDCYTCSIGGTRQKGHFIVEGIVDLHLAINESDSYLRVDENSVEKIGDIHQNLELLKEEST